jgi:hypothetical protein
METTITNSIRVDKNLSEDGRFWPKHVKDEILNTQILLITLDGIIVNPIYNY